MARGSSSETQKLITAYRVVMKNICTEQLIIQGVVIIVPKIAKLGNWQQGGITRVKLMFTGPRIILIVE